MPVYFRRDQTGFQLYVNGEGFPITQDDLRMLQRELAHILGGPPPARSWTRRTQTDTRNRPTYMQHEDEQIILTQGHEGPRGGWNSDTIMLNRREATQVRDFCNYWLGNWMGEEEFPIIGPTPTPDETAAEKGVQP